MNQNIRTKICKNYLTMVKILIIILLVEKMSILRFAAAYKVAREVGRASIELL